MPRARRVHQGERTQSEVPHEHPGHGEPMEGLEVPPGRTGTLTVHDDGTSEAHLEPEEGIVRDSVLSDRPLPDPKRLCKNCAKAAASIAGHADVPWAEVTAPSGLQHLAENPHVTVTLCGFDMTRWSA